MSAEPSTPPPATSLPPTQSESRKGLFITLGALVLVVALLLIPSLLPRGSALPSTLVSTTATLPVATTPASPTGGQPATPSAGSTTAGTGSPAALATAIATVTVRVAGPQVTRAPGLPVAQASAGPASPITTKPALPNTPAAQISAATPAAPPTAITVLDSDGAAFACASLPNCMAAAAPGVLLATGGEVRTGADGHLRLQTPGGLVILGADSTVQVGTANPGQTALMVNQGRVLTRSAPGREAEISLNAGGLTAHAKGSQFGVAVLPAGEIVVAVPVAAPRPVTVHPKTGADVMVPAGSQVTMTAAGVLAAAIPITPAEVGALAGLANTGPGSGGSVASAITVLPIPTVGPAGAGTITATIVLTPPAEHTLVAVTPVTIGGPAFSPTAVVPVPTPASVAARFSAAVGAMSAAGSYTFGATQGADAATAEFSAGTLAGDTACWVSTQNGQRTDHQVRGGSAFQRTSNGPWQQQAGSVGLPAWITQWKVLGQVDPATVVDLGSSQLDAVEIHHLRARVSPAAGQGANLWVDAFVGAEDSLVRSLVLYNGDPSANHAVFKIGFSSLGAALSCAPLPGAP